MSRIIIKRSAGPTSFPYQDGGQSNPIQTVKKGPLIHIQEIKHGISSQCGALDGSTFLTLRVKYKKTCYLRFVKPKNLDSIDQAQDKYSDGFNKQQQLQFEKMAKKGFEAFIRHLVAYIQNAARHGHVEVTFNIAETIDGFRRFRQKSAFDPHEHMRNFASWLQQIAGCNGTNPHLALGKAIVLGLRAAGYGSAKIETKYKKKKIALPQKPKGPQSNVTQYNFKSTPENQTLLLSHYFITVATVTSQTPHMDNLKTEAPMPVQRRILTAPQTTQRTL